MKNRSQHDRGNCHADRTQLALIVAAIFTVRTIYVDVAEQQARYKLDDQHAAHFQMDNRPMLTAGFGLQGRFGVARRSSSASYRLTSWQKEPRRSRSASPTRSYNLVAD